MKTFLQLRPEVHARRHQVGDTHTVVLHHEGRLLAIGEREWTVLRQLDGTRDLEGIARAAARAGATVAAKEIEAFLTELSRLGLVGPVDGDPAARETAFARDRPVRLLPSYGFHCDGGGDCCVSFETVQFTSLEVARARVTLPQVRDSGGSPAALFTPERGLEESVYAVAQQDGACALFDGRFCRLHAAGGAEAKPHGCRTFPVRLVDTGDELRASVKPECACVFSSLEDERAAPLLTARHGREVPAATFVTALPETVRLGADDVSSAGFIAWCDELAQHLDNVDAVELTETIARSIGAPIRDHGARVQALRGRMAALRKANAWRANADGFVVSLGLIDEALEALADDRHPPARAPSHEALYLRALLFAGVPALSDSVALDLNRRAFRLLVARAVPVGRSDAPLATVEAFFNAYLDPHLDLHLDS